MAYAPLQFDTTNIKGRFNESEYGHTFEYANAEMPIVQDGVTFDKIIFVGNLGETRHAHILKTVAYVITDETESGFIVQHWKIKGHRTY